jgi:hypothetical protein
LSTSHFAAAFEAVAALANRGFGNPVAGAVTGKVVAGAVALAVIAAGISWWQMDEATRQMLLSGTGKIVSWLLVVLFVPWATFFLTTWVAKRESNAAGAALVATYTVLEAVLLA